MRFFQKLFFASAVAGAGVCAPVFSVSAEEAAGSAADAALIKEELAYISALVESNLPDFAAPVIKAAKEKWPTLGPKLRVLELQGDLRLGDFDKVQKSIDAIKDKKSGEYWALKLSMADAYYARAKSKECAAIYKEFFSAVPNPGEDLIEFYVESGFKWVQMCVRDKNFDEAIKMFAGLLSEKMKLEEEQWCTLAMENVDLLLRLAQEAEEKATDEKASAKDKAAALQKRDGYLKQATTYVDKLLWKNELILVFGKAVSMKAHIEMLRGNLEKAQDLVNEYMPQLAEIHQSLLEQDPKGEQGYMRMSPMPACRYLLAQLMWEVVQKEAKKDKPNEDLMKDSLFGARVKGKRNGAGAYNHAINVFVKYPESSWAADAGELCERISAFVENRWKTKIKTNISRDQMRKVRQMQFANAEQLYGESDFKKAAEAYETVLAKFPEVEESLRAVSMLADCYVTLWQDEQDKTEKEGWRLSADAVEGYLAERFAGLKEEYITPAGDAVLRLAARERDLGGLARSQNLYDLFFKNYPTHYNAPQLALSMGLKAYQKEDWETAILYYGKIAETYTNSVNYVNALQYISTCYGKMGDEAKQEEWLRKFVKATKKPAEKVASQLRLALMQQKRGFADFARASETNDAAAVEAIQKAAYAGVAGAIRDFRGTATQLGKILEDKGLSKEDKDRFTLMREQAMYLEGESWQRLAWPENKVAVFRAQAVKAYEKYLEVNPKGRYAPQILVKIGTIHTANKDMEKSQDAFARLQKDFPDSDEARNSVPRLARTLIEMGLRAEGVAQYKQMLETPGGKYTAGQFLAAGDALAEAKGWDVAQEAYTKAVEMATGQSNSVAIVSRALLGQAKAHYGAGSLAEAHEKIDQFIEKYSKSLLVLQAYTMLVDVASEEGRREKDDLLRTKYFNQAVGAIKKLRGFKKTKAEQDVLDLDSAEVLVRKMEAEEGMNLKEQAKETCGKAVVTYQAFLMANEPTAEHPAKDMTAAQLANLERCIGAALPLMAKIGATQNEMVLKYGAMYNELFPNGKNKTAVQNALNQATANE